MKCNHCDEELSPRDHALTEIPDKEGGKAYHFMCTPVSAIEGLSVTQDGDTIGALLRKLSPGWQEGQMPSLAQAVADRIAARLSDAFRLSDGGHIPVSFDEIDFDGVFSAIGEAVGPEVSAAISKADSVRFRPDHADFRWPTMEQFRQLEYDVARIGDRLSDHETITQKAGERIASDTAAIDRKLERDWKRLKQYDGIGRDITNCENRLDRLERQAGLRATVADADGNPVAEVVSQDVGAWPAIEVDGKSLTELDARLKTMEEHVRAFEEHFPGMRTEHLQTQIANLERFIENAPLNGDVAAVRDRVAALEGAFGRLETLEKMVGRLEEDLRRHFR
jgi:hypothetical protein